MGKQQPAPPPQQASSFAIPPPPPSDPSDFKMPPKQKSSDPDIQKVLDQIDERQAKTEEMGNTITPEGMAFQMMRHVPREHWDTPLKDLGHWPRGSSVAEIKKNPELLGLTPAKAMLKLFEMSDKEKKKGQ